MLRGKSAFFNVLLLIMISGGTGLSFNQSRADPLSAPLVYQHLTVPTFSIINHETLITGSWPGADMLKLYIDGNLVYTVYSSSLTYKYYPSSVREHGALLEAYEHNWLGFYTLLGFEKQSTHTRWYVPESTTSSSNGSLFWGTNGAVHPNDLSIYEFATEVLDYGARKLGYTNMSVEQESAIRAFTIFSMDILYPNWDTDEDAKSDTEVLPYFQDFSPAMDSYTTTITLDCRDMNAFITGLARSLGLQARMVSIYTDEGKIAHVYTEIYGITRNYQYENNPPRSNNGWFLIDPAKQVSGLNSSQYIRMKMGLGENEYLTVSPHVLGNMYSSSENSFEGWGMYFTGSNKRQQTYWLFDATKYTSPPLTLVIINDPYFLKL